MDEYKAIFDSTLPEADKIVHWFDHVISQMVSHAEKEIELLRALCDEESVVKEQIKMETLKFAHGVLGDCYQRATGRKAQDDEQS